MRCQLTTSSILLRCLGLFLGLTRLTAGPAQAQTLLALLLPDSMQARLAQPGLPDTLRVRYLSQLSSALLGTNLPAATQAATQALALARRCGDKPGQVQAQSLVGNCHYLQGDVMAARHDFEALLALAQRTGVAQARGDAYLGMSLVAAYVNDTLNVPIHCAQALAAYQACRPVSQRGLARVFNCLGSFYRLTHQAAFDAQGLAGLDKNDTPSERARRMFRKTLALPPLGLAAEQAAAYLGLSGEYTLSNQPVLAQPYLDRAVALAPPQSPVWLKARLYSAQNHLGLGQARQALALAQQVRQVARKAGNATMAQNGLLITAEALEDLYVRGSFDSLQVYMSESAASMQTAQVAAVNAAEAGFHTREQQARIQVLEQGHRLTAQTQELTHLRTKQERVGIGVAVLVALLAGGGWFAQYRHDQVAARAAAAAALRQRLAADLHDDVGNLLTQISMQSSLLRENAHSPAQLLTRLDQLITTARHATQHMSDVVWGLHQPTQTLPELLDRMRDHAHEVLYPLGIEVDFEASPTVATATLAPEALQNLYLIYKEALHNVVKHAHATRATVRLSHSSTGLRLSVADNGLGHHTSPRANGNGLRNMQARAEVVGGTVKYVPQQPGFAVVVVLPAAA